ncbi:PAS domain S-box protein [Chlorobaculum sp. 24CR]|uniref:PAS domain S-box protein n=1 Tax=Chlorobaculum sp. 24CR TaxID=2508878 RepID=UPI00100BD8A6|nr:PAS domain S-box protein [Chlorobaculum sp. 24CR]RXK85010.1 PAS domain S-box protein [Chlorobaculum sp. 24CR]
MNVIPDSAGTLPYAPDKYTTILVVDADPVSRNHTAASVEQLGYTSLMADSDEACIELFGTCMIELLLLDISEPRKTGLKVLTYLHEHSISIPVIIVSSSSDIEQAIFSMNLGAYAYLLKPVSINRLGINIRNALTEFELRNKLMLFSAAITQLPLGVVITSDQGIIEYSNPGFTALSGYTEAEAKGQSMSILNSGANSKHFYRNFWETISAGKIWQGEIVNKKKNGERYTEYCIVCPITGPDAEIVHFISIKQDITQRKKEQEALAESEQSFQELADLLLQPVFEIDLTGNIIFSNKAGLDLFGYTRSDIAQGFEATRLFAPEERLRVLQNMTARVKGISFDNHEYITQKKDGTTFPMLIYTEPIIRRGVPIGIRGLGIDITERKRNEEKLLELNQTLEERVRERTQELEVTHQQMILQEKLASIGQLAAGLAHEINNPVNFVRINFATLREDVNDLGQLVREYRSLFENIRESGPMPEALEKVKSLEKKLNVDALLNELPELFDDSRRGFERIGTILSSMRNFSFQHALDQRVPFDLNQGIRDTLIIAQNEYRYYAEVDTRLAELPPAACNPEQINQVFLNLVVNCAHAIASQKRHEKGRIIIETGYDEEVVWCTIADDGPGIPPEIRNRIFEPFFTTKEPGKGTGLGLSISYDIIANKHGGTLAVSCPPQGGSVFTIRLPLKAAPAPEAS